MQNKKDDMAKKMTISKPGSDTKVIVTKPKPFVPRPMKGGKGRLA